MSPSSESLDLGGIWGPEWMQALSISLTLRNFWKTSITRTEKITPWRTERFRIPQNKKYLWRGRFKSYFSFCACKQELAKRKVTRKTNLLTTVGFLNSFPMYHATITSSKYTSIIKKPNSPLLVSHIRLLQVVSHLQLDYLLWAITDLPRVGEGVAIVKTRMRLLLRHQITTNYFQYCVEERRGL